MDDSGHIATAPAVAGATPALSRRDIRALENRMRARRSDRPLSTPGPAPTPPKRASMRQRFAAGGAMTLITLFTVSASLPALAMNPPATGSLATSTTAAGGTAGTAGIPDATDTGDAAGTGDATDTGDTQSLSFSGTASAPVERDGFTVTEVPKPAPPVEAADSGGWASLTQSQASDQGWALPVLGRVTSPYGARPEKPVAGVGDYHNGTDIAAPCDQPVSAAMGGTVVDAGYQGSYGNWILIEHADGVQTGYAHNSTLLVDAGQEVAAGEVIALVGSTGSSSGCHVHFETRVDGDFIDPEPFMASRGVSLG